MAKVLIVDDIPFMRSLLKSLLMRGGHEVISEAENGQDALVEYINCHPEIVLLDMYIPNMNGLATLKRLKKIDPAVKVIFVSAEEDPDVIKVAINSGAKGYILKPFQSKQMMQEIQRVVNM